MWLDKKYIGLLSPRLSQFKVKNNGYNFRCPLCGDSQKSKTKSRGWIYQEKGKYKFHCFNCDYNCSFSTFLKKIDEQLFSSYKFDQLQENKSQKQKDFDEFVEKLKPKPYTKTPLKSLKKISQLSQTDIAKTYVSDRKIPNIYHSKLFSCPNFMKWVNENVFIKFEDNALLRDEKRIVIPFFNKDGVLHALQGRSLKDNSEVKYITIVLDDTIPKVYGLDTVNFNKKVYVLEGPIDAMFLDNAISTAGGDMIPCLKDFPKKNLVLVYDNEPRSKQTKEKLDKAIDNGYSVCIWPKNLEHKDINKMILAGITKDHIQYIIDQNTYYGLEAKLHLSIWSKS